MSLKEIQTMVGHNMILAEIKSLLRRASNDNVTEFDTLRIAVRRGEASFEKKLNRLLKNRDLVKDEKVAAIISEWTAAMRGYAMELYPKAKCQEKHKIIKCDNFIDPLRGSTRLNVYIAIKFTDAKNKFNLLICLPIAIIANSSTRCQISRDNLALAISKDDALVEAGWLTGESWMDNMKKLLNDHLGESLLATAIDKQMEKARQILLGISMSDCDETGDVEKRGTYKFARELRYMNYNYQHSDIDEDDKYSLNSMVERKNPNPDRYPLYADFCSEKGYFYVNIKFTASFIKEINDNPQKFV